MTVSWFGETLELRVGGPGHGGFCVARHDGRVVFVRHSLPGELVRATITEDKGKSFCRADAVEILEPSSDRIASLCPISGPGGSGCCDFSFATPAAVRSLKATVLSEQLARIGGIERDVVVEELPGAPDGTGWRSRVRLAVDSRGRAGYRRLRSTSVLPDLRCPQPMAGIYDGLGDRAWRPGSELYIAIDSDGSRHLVEAAPPPATRTARSDGGRAGAVARRVGAISQRRHRTIEGTGRAVQRVGGRSWEFDAAGFWQAHRGAPERYSEVVSQFASAESGATAWDLYAGVGVFAAALGESVGPSGSVGAVESSHGAVRDGRQSLADLPQVGLVSARVERAFDRLPVSPSVVVLDPPRSGAGKAVIEGVAQAGPARVIHVGCDPASFARDAGLYAEFGYRLTTLRAFDAFPLTHHVECIGLFER